MTVERGYWKDSGRQRMLMDPLLKTGEIAAQLGLKPHQVAAARARVKKAEKAKRDAGEEPFEVAGESTPQERKGISIPTTRTVADEIRRILDLAARRIQRNLEPDNVRRILGEIRDQLTEEVERALDRGDFWAAQVTELEEEIDKLRGGGQA